LLPRRIKGTIRFSPDAVTSQVFDIDQDGRHRWWPVSPTGRIRLEMRPGQRAGPAMATWTATGAANRSKTVSSSGTGRADNCSDGDAVILYDAIRKDGGRGQIALRIGATGR
jgi:carotenoid 1,2-hydratase